ncbi:hypothetical protein [Actinomadura parmotrematis]|uniref:DUF3494 domain-containing protein n=1 Tax=Actinomadura parmotrematis TaxID=2864039 RepID=A0ABS7G2F7_9ACTN|nr:hypothetical protein [Actinomadura parmotrematis]MBW8486905.1 hypothetical protein [Actinomadura parmotrematis]
MRQADTRPTAGTADHDRRAGAVRGTRAVLRAGLRRAALAAVPVTAAAAAGLAVTAAAPAARADAPAPVACTGTTGDVAALVKAFQTGGPYRLGKKCDYELTKREGAHSALPTVTKDTTVDGAGSSITWSGTEPIRSVFSVAPGARLRLSDVTVYGAGAAGSPTVSLGRGSTLTLTDSSISVDVGSDTGAGPGVTGTGVGVQGVPVGSGVRSAGAAGVECTATGDGARGPATDPVSGAPLPPDPVTGGPAAPPAAAPATVPDAAGTTSPLGATDVLGAPSPLGGADALGTAGTAGAAGGTSVAPSCPAKTVTKLTAGPKKATSSSTTCCGTAAGR